MRGWSRIISGWLGVWLVWVGHLPALALDEVKCAAANAKVASTYSEYASARTAYDYCRRYGDTSGTGYGSTDCDAAQTRMYDAKYKYDDALSDQWHYCR